MLNVINKSTGRVHLPSIYYDNPDAVCRPLLQDYPRGAYECTDLPVTCPRCLALCES